MSGVKRVVGLLSIALLIAVDTVRTADAEMVWKPTRCFDLPACGIAVGDGDNTGDLEIYIAGATDEVYQCKWNGNDWVETDLTGRIAMRLHSVTVGDGDNDGEMEVYVGGEDMRKVQETIPTHPASAYQCKWDGNNWIVTEMGFIQGRDTLRSITIGDADNDGLMEVYGITRAQTGDFDGGIYQYKWNGASWHITTVDEGPDFGTRIVVGDSDNDGKVEIYGVCTYPLRIYQYKWKGTLWDKVEIFRPGASDCYALGIGDITGSGEMRIYMGDYAGNIWEIRWNGSLWENLLVDSIEQIYSLGIGDGNRDGKPELYIGTYPGTTGARVLQYRWINGTWVGKVVHQMPATSYPYISYIADIEIEDGDDDGRKEVYINTYHYPHIFGVFQLKPVFNAPPGSPTLVSPENGIITNDNTPTFTWANATDSDGDVLTYKILVDNNSDFSSPEINMAGITETANLTSYTPGEPLPVGTYYWKVCANDGFVNGPFSDIWSVTIISPVTTLSATITEEYLEKWAIVIKDSAETIVEQYEEVVDGDFAGGETVAYVWDGKDTAGNIVPEGIYTFTYKAIDKSGNSAQASGTLEVREGGTLSLENVVSSSGGSVTDPTGTEVVVPPGAVEEETTISIMAENKDESGKEPNTDKQESAKKQRLNPIGAGRIFGPEGIQFNKPVKVTIPYTDADIDGTNEADLKIYYWNKVKSVWELIANSKAIPEENKVTAEVTHFSLYQIMAPVPLSPNELPSICVYPNPFRPSNGDTKIVFGGLKEHQTTIYVYNINGELVKIIEHEGSEIPEWGGCNEAGQPVASGIYIYVIKASPTFKKGKLAIIK